MQKYNGDNNFSKFSFGEDYIVVYKIQEFYSPSLGLASIYSRKLCLTEIMSYVLAQYNYLLVRT